MSEPSMKYSEVWKDQRSEQSHPFTQKKRLNRTLLSRLLTPLGLTLVAASIGGAYYHQRCYTEAQEPAIQMPSDLIDHLSTGTARDLLKVNEKDFSEFVEALNKLKPPYTDMMISIFIWPTGAIGLKFELEQWTFRSNGELVKLTGDVTTVTLDNCTMVNISKTQSQFKFVRWLTKFRPGWSNKDYAQCLDDLNSYVEKAQKDVARRLPKNVTWNQINAVSALTADKLIENVDKTHRIDGKVSYSANIARLDLTQMLSPKGAKRPPQRNDGCDGCTCIVM